MPEVVGEHSVLAAAGSWWRLIHLVDKLCKRLRDTKVGDWQVSSRRVIMTMTAEVTWKQLSRASVAVVRAC